MKTSALETSPVGDDYAPAPGARTRRRSSWRAACCDTHVRHSSALPTTSITRGDRLALSGVVDREVVKCPEFSEAV